MLVYGDPSSCCTAGELLDGIEACLRARNGDRIDVLRSALILAGELEQGICDGGLREAQPVSEKLTGLLASRFLDEWQPGRGCAPRWILEEQLKSLQRWRDERLRTKTPEGFSFYGLFPEQYALAAQAWARSHPDAPVAVIGIRSIGTTLSAVVAESLRRLDRCVRRTTVRPTGHPFSRSVDLDRSSIAGVKWVLVVDEGPGLSGSSMASVVRALDHLRIPRNRIALVPGHAGEPGSEASPETRRIWRKTGRIQILMEDVRWRGSSLQEILSEKAETLLGAPIQSFEDISAGAWRKHVFDSEESWPAAFAEFERVKYLAASDNGNAVVWKFYGLGGESETAHAELCRRSEDGVTVRPLAFAHGFLAFPWISPPRLGELDDSQAGPRPELRPIPDERASEAPGRLNASSPPRLHAGIPKLLGRYIAKASGPPLDSHEAWDAHGRLIEMVRVNVGETLGPDAAQILLDRIEPHKSLTGWRRYGDGRMGPEEWVNAADGSLRKVDAWGHDRDHTYVGPQPVLWDLAGTAVEWEMDHLELAAMLQSFEAASARNVTPEWMDFYLAAYCAFRLGMCSMASSLARAEEADRLAAAADRYRSRLTATLEPKHGNAYLA